MTRYSENVFLLPALQLAEWWVQSRCPHCTYKDPRQFEQKCHHSFDEHFGFPASATKYIDEGGGSICTPKKHQKSGNLILRYWMSVEQQSKFKVPNGLLQNLCVSMYNVMHCDHVISGQCKLNSRVFNVIATNTIIQQTSNNSKSASRRFTERTKWNLVCTLLSLVVPKF